MNELFNIGLSVGEVKGIIQERCNKHANFVTGYSHKLVYGLFGHIRHQGSRFGFTRLYKKSLGRFTGFAENENYEENDQISMD